MISKRLKNNIISAEGYRPRAYKDHLGNDTFGYGFTSLAIDECDAVLEVKLQKLASILSDRIEGLSPEKQEVLIEMAYNLGVAGLYRFYGMWAAIERGNYSEAAWQIMNSKAARDPRLADRYARFAKGIKA